MPTQSNIEKLNNPPQAPALEQLPVGPAEDRARDTQQSLEQLKQEVADLTPSPSSRLVRARMNV